MPYQKGRPVERKQATTAFFLLALSAIALYFCYVIARPFLSPVFLAVMIAIVFHPVHARIQSRIRGRNTAALISTVLVLLALAPLVLPNWNLEAPALLGQAPTAEAMIRH